MAGMDAMTVVALGLGTAGLLMLTLAGVLSRRTSDTNARLAVIERQLRLVMDHLGVAEPEPEGALEDVPDLRDLLLGRVLGLNTAPLVRSVLGFAPKLRDGSRLG